MDIEAFLKERTAFIQYFYEQATKSFIDIIDAIEHERDPFVPPYSGGEEPAFQNEWMQAKTGIEMVGHAALSMLSSSLKLYLEAWKKRLEQGHPASRYTGEEYIINCGNGWLNGYKQICIQLNFNMDECPANFDIIEQIVLARNRVQHPENITSLDVQHSNSDLDRYPRPYFIQEHELGFIAQDEVEHLTWWLHIGSTKEKILDAIKQVNLLCSWLESEYWK